MGGRGNDYTTVTEAPGDQLRPEALDMLWTRYRYAAQFCGGRTVLEVGCGAGQGLGVLAHASARVVGGDYTERLLSFARAHYGSRVPLVRLDAHRLPFAAGSFDVILLYEAIYYLREPRDFLAECRRVLRPGGSLLICLANRRVTDFNPSPYSVRYYSADELAALLSGSGYRAEILGAFPAVPATARDRVISLIKRAAVALHLVPRTMKGKALLKRLFFGNLAAAPAELVDGVGEYHAPVPLAQPSDHSLYRVLFARAQPQ
jgi:SAM-dependent methyltransferase